MSQTTDILKHLLKGNRLTGMQALNIFGCNRLPARIKNIEKITGKRPERKMVLRNKKYVMQYWIDKPKK